MYNGHPYFEASFQKKKAFQWHSWWKIIFWKNLAETSNPALPARKSVAGVDANHLMFCLFGDTSNFMMFSSFSSAVLLLHDPTRPFAQRLEHYYEQGVLELDFLATWQDSRWHCKKYLHDVFSFKSFHICSINQKISESIVLLQSLEENSSWNLLFHGNTPENATDFQSWS